MTKHEWTADEVKSGLYAYKPGVDNKGTKAVGIINITGTSEYTVQLVDLVTGVDVVRCSRMIPFSRIQEVEDGSERFKCGVKTRVARELSRSGWIPVGTSDHIIELLKTVL